MFRTLAWKRFLGRGPFSRNWFWRGECVPGNVSLLLFLKRGTFPGNCFWRVECFPETVLEESNIFQKVFLERGTFSRKCFELWGQQWNCQIFSEFVTFKTLCQLRACILNMFGTLAWKLFLGRGPFSRNWFWRGKCVLENVSQKRNILQILCLKRGTFPRKCFEVRGQWRN